MQVVPLTDMKQNLTGSVVHLGENLKVRSRLLSFGVMPGVSVRVLQNRGRSALLIEVDGLRFALDRVEAAHIHVSRE